MNPVLSGLLGVLLGAALTAAGFIVLDDPPEPGTTVVAPAPEADPPKGGRAEPSAGGLAAENARLTARVAQLEGRVRAVVGGADRLTTLKAKQAALQAELARAKAAAADEAAARKDTEGEPIPFPADLPAEFRQEGLRDALAEALEASGLDATVDAVDCSEFPCIAYGHAQRDWADREALDTAFKAFTGVLSKRWPDPDHRHHTSVWAGKGTLDDGSTVKRTSFGLAVYPRAFGEGRAPALRKRLRFRQQQYNEAGAAD